MSRRFVMPKQLTMLLWICSSLAACVQEQSWQAPPVLYEGDIATLLRTKCARCHGADRAAADFRVDTYAHVLGCPSSSPELRAIDRGEKGRPILVVLERADHADLLDVEQRTRLRAWLEAGAPLRQSAVHGSQLLNPRSPEWHGKLAAADSFGALLRPDHPLACGRCHGGAPVKPAKVRFSAPGATACTHCHAQPAGVLACSTCHGDGGARSSPPRDACMFEASVPDAHRAHLESTRLSEPLACGTCHPAADAQLSGSHANGTVDIALDPTLAGSGAQYDSATRQCAVACHDRRGARPTPSFREAGPMGCGDCHASPPQDHYAGACDGCHIEADADGTALRSHHLHLNAQIDLGDGSGRCSACHGQGEDPMPPTLGHRLHAGTELTREITCAECHTVPETPTSPGHLDSGGRTPADVVFGARATARNQPAEYMAGTCRNIACHGAGLAEGIERALVWDTPGSGTCSGCHGLPPSQDHPADEGCASLICHGAEVSFGGSPPSITVLGRAKHIDSKVDTGNP